MIVNWLVETKKWYSQVKYSQYLKPKERIISILLGVTASLITPYRVGDIGARLALIQPENRRQVLYFNSFLAGSQFLVSMIFGFGSLMFYDEWQLLFGLQLRPYSTWLIALLLPLMGILYFRSQAVGTLFKWGGKSKMTLVKISLKDRLVTLCYSVLRYIIFCVQFYLLFQVMDIQASFYIAFNILSLIFLVKTIIPSSFISEVAIRVSLTYFVFGLFDLNGIDGIVVSFLLWFINLIIPALIGSLLMFKIKWLRLNDI